MSLHAFAILPQDLKLNISGGTSDCPLKFGSSPVGKDGKPQGVLVINGLAYTNRPDNLPAFVKYKDGGVEIREHYTVDHMTEAEYIVSGSTILLKDGRIVKDDNPALPIRPTLSLRRTGLGITKEGYLVVFVTKGTVYELQTAMKVFGVEEAIMLAYEESYLNYPQGGVKMGTQPITVLEATRAKELKRPIVVIDPGHGGTDPGAVGFGMKEKELNLEAALLIHRYLVENFEGTFLLTRATDETMNLQTRTNLANSVKADFFFSVHHNASGVGGTGFESFTMEKASDTTKAMQKAIHTATMTSLVGHGFRNRGMKEARFYVLRMTTMPAVLVENLFIDHVRDAEFLKDRALRETMYLANAVGIAKGLKLEPRKQEEPEQPFVEPETTLYRVQVGAFRYRKGAEALLEQLKKDGYEGFIKKD